VLPKPIQRPFPLWIGGNEPKPGDEGSGAFVSTDWNEAAVMNAISFCRDTALREQLLREPDLGQRAMNTLFHRNYYPTRFEARPPIYCETHAREPWLSLPFRAEDFVGIVFPRS
jgi:hypothetical protein